MRAHLKTGTQYARIPYQENRIRYRMMGDGVTKWHFECNEVRGVGSTAGSRCSSTQACYYIYA